MDNLDLPLLSCDKDEKIATLNETQKHSATWKMWSNTLTGVRFRYSVIKVRTAIIRMIVSVNSHTSTSKNTNKIRHRKRFSRLKSVSLDTDTNEDSFSQTSTQYDNPAYYCTHHSDMTGLEKCHRCKESLCFDCRQQLPLGPCMMNYCSKCVDDVSCVIQ